MIFYRPFFYRKQFKPEPIKGIKWFRQYKAAAAMLRISLTFSNAFY